MALISEGLLLKDPPARDHTFLQNLYPESLGVDHATTHVALSLGPIPGAEQDGITV